MKIGACIYTKDLKLAKEFGYDFVELSGREISSIPERDWIKVCNTIKNTEIEILGFNDFCDNNNPIVGPEVNHFKNTIYTEQLLKRASDLNCKYVGIGSPKARKVPDHFKEEQSNAQIEQFLKMICKIANKYNIIILYEALNSFESDFHNSSVEVIHTVNKLEIDNLYLVWDLYHHILSEDTFPLDRSNLVKHIHICGINNDQRTYFTDRNIKSIRTLKEVLYNVNYTNNISIEANPNEFSIYGKDSLIILKDCFDTF